MTPDERAARLHLTDAAVALRTASERLCDWLEATGQDVAGNGHVASADEAAGSFREAPTAPVSSSPPPIPLGAVVTVTVNGVEWQREDGEWDDAEGGGPPNKADALDFLDRIAELEREVHLARNDEALALSTSREWESYCKRAERERDAARRELAAAQGKALEFDRIQRACPAGVDAFDHLMALAAAKDQGIGASAISSRQAPNSEESDCGSAVASPAPAPAPLSDPAPLSGAGNMADSGNQAPAPASAPCGHTNTSPSPDSPHARVAAPRRWWLRRRSDAGWPDAHAYLSEEMARSALYGPTGGGWSDVVPVLEARVTRETVEEIAATLTSSLDITPSRSIGRTVARLVAKRIGLTVEE